MESRWARRVDLEGISDSELIAASRIGDRDAYSELWRRHSGVALATARPLALADAEDVVSDTFEAIWDQLQRNLGPREYFRAYALAVVRNIAARRYRVRNRTVTGVDLEDLPVGGDGQLLPAEDSEEIISAFQSLPKRWQQALWWLEVEGLPRAEVSRRLSLTPNSVSALARRAKEGLRLAWMREQLPPPGDGPHRAAIEALPKYIRGGDGASLSNKVRIHIDSCDFCAAAESQLRAKNQRFGGKAGGSLFLLALGGSALSSTFEPVPAAAAPIDDKGRPRGDSSAGELGLDETFFVQHPHWLATTGVSLALLGAVTVFMLPKPSMEPLTKAAATSESTPRRAADSPTDAQRREQPDAGTEDLGANDIPEGDRPVGVTPGSGATPEDTGIPPYDPPSKATGTFTVNLAGSGSGGFAPVLSGSGEAGSTVDLSLADLTYSVPVANDGTWSSDLSTLDLAPGTHHVIAQQSVPGWVPAAISVSFSITVPLMTALLVDSPTQATGGSEAEIEFTGIPGVETCVALGPGVYQRFSLDSVGHAAGIVPLWKGSEEIKARYCSGERFGAWVAVPVR